MSREVVIYLIFERVLLFHSVKKKDDHLLQNSILILKVSGIFSCTFP